MNDDFCAVSSFGDIGNWNRPSSVVEVDNVGTQLICFWPSSPFHWGRWQGNAMIWTSSVHGKVFRNFAIYHLMQLCESKPAVYREWTHTCNTYESYDIIWQTHVYSIYKHTHCPGPSRLPPSWLWKRDKAEFWAIIGIGASLKRFRIPVCLPCASFGWSGSQHNSHQSPWWRISRVKDLGDILKIFVLTIVIMLHTLCSPYHKKHSKNSLQTYLPNPFSWCSTVPWCWNDVFSLHALHAHYSHLVKLVDCLRVRSPHSSFAGHIGDQHGASTLEALEAENTTCISTPPTNHFLHSRCLIEFWVRDNIKTTYCGIL